MPAAQSRELDRLQAAVDRAVAKADAAELATQEAEAQVSRLHSQVLRCDILFEKISAWTRYPEVVTPFPWPDAAEWVTPCNWDDLDYYETCPRGYPPRRARVEGAPLRAPQVDRAAPGLRKIPGSVRVHFSHVCATLSVLPSAVS